MAIHPVSLNIADIQMALEMHDASPDGARERERVIRLAAELTDETIELNGYWCGPDCIHD